MKILFINACVRNSSRTKMLADYLLTKLQGDVTEFILESSDICALTRESLQKRDSSVEETVDFKYALQFAEADIIVIAAPFWDYSFPALLKDYIERINVLGVTFDYENDLPVGLCKAQKLYYVTTAGGVFVPDYGYNYIKRAANDFYGIKETYCIYAEKLDILGSDTEDILQKAKNDIDDLFGSAS